MKNLQDVITEKLRIGKSIKVDHTDDYFPFDCINKENECYTIDTTGDNWLQLFDLKKFRLYLMNVFKKTKYKDMLYTITYKSKNETYYLNPIVFEKKPRSFVRYKIYQYDNSDASDIEKYIKKNYYTFVQKKIGNASYLNSSCHANILHDISRRSCQYICRHVHISWLNNCSCIAVNFECE